MSLKKNLAKNRGSSESGNPGLFGDKTHSFPAIDRQDTSHTETTRKILIKVDPERCRPWKWHNRDSWWLTPERLAALVNSIQTQGQMQPGIARSIEGDPDYDYEIIYGVRRWHACKLAGIPYTAEKTTKSDEQCALMMQDENELGEDISELEKSFAMADQLPLFKSASEMSRALNLSRQMVSRRLSIANLRDYPDVMKLLSPVITGVSARMAKALIEHIESDPKNQKSVNKKARSIPIPSVDSDTLQESIDQAHQLATSIISELTKRDSRASKAENKRITTYVENTKGKPVVSLTEANGKVSLSLNAVQLKKLQDEFDKEKVFKAIIDDLKEYF